MRHFVNSYQLVLSSLADVWSLLVLRVVVVELMIPHPNTVKWLSG